MECIEARALKSSFLPEIIGMKSYQQGYFDDFWCVAGINNVVNVSSDEFSVDDLLDLSDKEFGNPDGESFEESSEAEFASIYSSENDSNSMNSAKFSSSGDLVALAGDQLLVPIDDMESLEWLSQIVDDSVSELPILYPAPAVKPPAGAGTTMSRIEPVANVAEAEVNHNLSEMEKLLGQMRVNYEALEGEKKKLEDQGKKVMEEKKELESNLAKVSSEAQGLRQTVDDFLSFKKFIFTEGMKLISHYIHKGQPLTKAVSGVVNAMNLCGFAEGVKAGYAGAASGISLEKNVQVPENPEADLTAAVQAFDTVTFPEIQKLQDLVGEDVEKIVATLRGLKV